MWLGEWTWAGKGNWLTLSQSLRPGSRWHFKSHLTNCKVCGLSRCVEESALCGAASGAPCCVTCMCPWIQRKQEHLENPVLSTSAFRTGLIYLYFALSPLSALFFKTQESVAFSRGYICWEVKIGFKLWCSQVLSKNVSQLLGRGLKCTTCRNNIYLTYYSWMVLANDLKFFMIASI